MADAAVIFDVDGVLLELTTAEEDAFFVPFENRYGLKNISRDWNAYKIRNDENIVAEILERHGIPQAEKPEVISDYLSVLEQRLANRAIEAIVIPGAPKLLQKLEGEFHIGIATANFLSAAKLRLNAKNLWNPVSSHAFGAEGGGHKRQTVARAIASVGLPKSRIVYVGDNLNDVDAGLSNGVHFIGFSIDSKRLQELANAGSEHTSNNHVETYRLIGHLLKQEVK
jgi:phosphoglycolate phosphatase-like HAD superfamily hydrolase